MNLYLLTQDENTGYDTYDSCIVCAETVEQAKQINPIRDDAWTDSYPEWATSPDRVKATLIGEADDSIKRGVVLASYNAG